jgi:hypothetical protein
MPNTTFDYSLTHIFLQTMNGTNFGEKYVIKSNESTKGEGV